MGIFDALNTAVGGLQAQSFALQNISGNIANASTTGYKGIDTSFEDLIPDATSPSRQVAGGGRSERAQSHAVEGWSNEKHRWHDGGGSHGPRAERVGRGLRWG